MFELKKYTIKKAFNGYREGQIIAFNGADAQKYAAFIVLKEKKAAPVIPNTAENKETKPKIKHIRKGKK